MSISSQVGELHQLLNNTLKDPRQNNSCSLSPYLRKREREREGERNTEWSRGGEGGGTVQRMIRLRLYVKFVRLLSEIQRL